MRLALVINSRLVCVARLSNNERVTNALITNVTRTLVKMSSQDGKPPFGAILVNVPAATSTGNSDILDRQEEKDCTKVKAVNEVGESHVSTAHASSSAQISRTEAMEITYDHLKTKQTMDIPVMSKVSGRKSGGVKSQKQLHIGLDLSFRNDDEQTSDTVVKSQKRKVHVKKKSVLPKNLLENVTDIIRQQKSISSDNVVNGSETYKPAKDRKHEKEELPTKLLESQKNTMAFGIINENIPAFEDTPERLLTTGIDVEVQSRSEIDYTSCSETDIAVQSMEAEADGDLTCDTFMDSSIVMVEDTEVNDKHTDEVTESGDELLFPDLIEEPSVNTKTEEDVLDISPLFTGELDRRYKREKKKASKWKGKKNKGKKKDKQGEDTGEHEDGKAEKKLLPNYFVAIQITNKKIHEAVQKVQEEVLKEESLLSSAMIKLVKLHLTLMVLRIDTEEDLVRSKQAMDTAMDKLLSVYSNKALTFDLGGIGNFRNEIVFAKIKDETQVAEVKAIADIVEDSLLSQDLISPDKHGFKPHVTVMKLSKAKHLRKKGIKKIDEKLYKDFQSTEFGIEHVTKLQLCNMMKTDSTGYYLVEHEVLFPSGKVSVNDSGFEENSFTEKEEPNGIEVTDTPEDEHKENTGELMESTVDRETSESCRMTHTSDVLGEKTELSEKSADNDVMEDSPEVPSTLSEDTTHVK